MAVVFLRPSDLNSHKDDGNRNRRKHRVKGHDAGSTPLIKINHVREQVSYLDGGAHRQGEEEGPEAGQGRPPGGSRGRCGGGGVPRPHRTGAAAPAAKFDGKL